MKCCLKEINWLFWFHQGTGQGLLPIIDVGGTLLKDEGVTKLRCDHPALIVFLFQNYKTSFARYYIK